jgi:hypothetical protein
LLDDDESFFTHDFLLESYVGRIAP